MNIIIRSTVAFALVLTGCATNPPPLSPGNPTDPQVQSSPKTPRNVLARDETTLAIERELGATQAHAENAEKMEHNMPGMVAPKKDEGHEDH
jgi:hypothetical protein